MKQQLRSVRYCAFLTHPCSSVMLCLDVTRCRLCAISTHRGWITQNPTLGYDACEAAYNKGEPWRQALLEHLRGNRAALYSFIEERLPELKIDPMEATYLAWVDVRELGYVKTRNGRLHFESGRYVRCVKSDFFSCDVMSAWLCSNVHLRAKLLQ